MDDRRLVAFLEGQGAKVRRLAPAEVRAARERWREEYGPATGQRSWSWSDQGFDWHVFSLERHEAVEGRVATLALRNSTAHTHVFLVLAARDDVLAGVEVRADRAIELEELGEDWSTVAEDWSWSMTWTSAGEGPYFARP